jgi:hypothetical protein
MAAVPSIKEALEEQLRDLPVEKQQEVLDFAQFLGAKFGEEVPRKPLKSMRGILKHTGISISAEEIDEARKEMWGNFPREHFFAENPENPTEPG